MRYSFGDYILDTERHELLRADTPIKLRPKVFQVLAYLVSHRDRMVPKDELLGTIWPRVVGDAVLNSCVMAARQAVGDDGRAQNVIKTRHGLGYRFVAPASESEHGSADMEAPEDPRPATDHQPSHPPAAEPTPPPPGPGTTPNMPSGLAREHKTVTVLACAIVQAEEFAQRLGAEAMHELMQGFFRHARTVMDRYEGTIVQWGGDGFLALFGAPVAHEDDGRRAVLASVELTELLKEPEPSKAGSPPADSPINDGHIASIGLHTGPVVVGAMDETPFQQPYTARGETTDIASRLQSDAAPGGILLSENTYRQVEAEIEAEPQDGRKDSPPAYRFLGIVKRRAGVPQRFQSHLSQFVGRSTELAILHERLARAVSEAGQAISVTGVPGIGKSRLLDEFCQSLSAEAVMFLRGQCLPYGKTTPYLPLVELVRDLCAIGETDDTLNTTTNVRAYLERMETTEETEPLLLELLGVPVERELLIRLSPQARRARTFALLNELLFAAATARPMVIVIEDLHWIDATSQEWLDGFVARLGDSAILLLVTYRPPHSPAWLGRSSATQLALPPLTPRHSAMLVKSIFSQAELAHTVTEDLVAKGDGNPFFLEELTQAMDGDPDGPRSAAIPDTVQAVLASRIDRLDPIRKRLLQTCSVIGPRIPHALLRHVSGVDEDILDLGLAQLEETGFLLEARAMPVRTFRFKHALTQDVTYQGLLRGSRENLHAQLAEILERHFDDIVAHQPEMLARHHTEAGNSKAAVAYWQRAGRKAYERSANIEAISYSTKGLEVLAGAADDEDGAKNELSLQLTLAPALMAAKGYASPEVERASARAQTLCEQIGDERQLFRALVGSWNLYWVRGELATARDVATRLLSLAESANDPVPKIRAHAAMGEILFHTGELEASHEHLQRGVALYEEIASGHSFAAQTPQVACLSYAAWASWHLGHSDQSIAHAAEAVALADQIEHPLSLALSLTLKSELHQFRLEIHECRTFAERAVAVSRAQGFPFWEGSSLILLGWAQAMGGDFDRGHGTMKKGLTVFAETGARVQQTPWLGMLAEIHSHAGHIDDGLRIVEEALSWVDQTGEQHYSSELHRLRGELLLSTNRGGNGQAAEAAFGQAIDIARRQGAKMRELCASVNLARLRQDRGRTEEAAKVLQSALSRCAEDRGGTEISGARSLLDSLS